MDSVYSGSRLSEVQLNLTPIKLRFISPLLTLVEGLGVRFSSVLHPPGNHYIECDRMDSKYKCVGASPTVGNCPSPPLPAQP
jgi:hypothetical protein